MQLDLGDNGSELLPVEPDSPTPHGDKLRELPTNLKLPPHDQQRVQEALVRYYKWLDDMRAVLLTGDEKVRRLVQLTNEYKKSVELDLIWDSEADFLFRQRGQLKLDNSIVEEFLPFLVDRAIIPELEGKKYCVGPRNAFASVYFVTSLLHPSRGGGLQFRTKDQDFTVGQEVYIRSSLDCSFSPSSTVDHKTYLAFVAAECKTNLDKTMFQEAIATAHDLKVAVSGAKYYLLCEWLDMTPISTTGTDIDEVLILRGKRISSNIRAEFSTYQNRVSRREWYEKFLDSHPIQDHVVLRFVGHLRTLFAPGNNDEGEVLTRGYF